VIVTRPGRLASKTPELRRMTRWCKLLVLSTHSSVKNNQQDGSQLSNRRIDRRRAPLRKRPPAWSCPGCPVTCGWPFSPHCAGAPPIRSSSLVAPVRTRLAGVFQHITISPARPTPLRERGPTLSPASCPCFSGKYFWCLRSTGTSAPAIMRPFLAVPKVWMQLRERAVVGDTCSDAGVMWFVAMQHQLTGNHTHCMQSGFPSPHDQSLPGCTT